jgi:hypothetical protein
VKPPFEARLACGCIVRIQEAPDGRALTGVVARKASTCTMPIHVGGMPVYDHRSALRPPTRVVASLQPDYEDG